MAALQPWHKVATPREDLREKRPLDASEFAVHLDQVRDERAPDVYQVPERFFERTYLTKQLLELSSQVARRLSGETTETSAVFNLATQFGGGKTHALTLLYHLGSHGPLAKSWVGVDKILQRAGIPSVPKADVAVFVGTEFDSLTGRGGDDGTPRRRTPWGEIAFQLGGAPALEVLAEHEREFIEPKGDVIRRLLPKERPCLILMDEIINYVSTYRSKGYGDRLYNFIQALSETARGMNNVALVVSIPASELAYTAPDHGDEVRFRYMLDRLGKALLLSAETETAEIIRRRLFEWDPRKMSQGGRVLLDKAAVATCDAFAKWAVEHRKQLPGWFPVDDAKRAFEDTYPFHPMVVSVFERKWRALPRFQQTRGVLRLLALWVANAYHEGFQGAQKDPLIGMGTAPLDDPMFRAAIFEQLDEQRLEAVVTTDICGKADAHARRLDAEAPETLKKARLHRKAATAIFFESNGGQTLEDATLPEIRLAVAEPEIDLGNVETVLDGLQSACYYLNSEHNRYRFGLKPNLNKLLSDRRASIAQNKIDDRVRAQVQKVFPKLAGIEVVPFPERSNAVLDRAVVTLVVLPPEQSMADRAATTAWLEGILRECGHAARTFKSALLFSVPESAAALQEEARKLLAWEAIRDDAESLGLDDGQKRQLAENLSRAARDLQEAAWRSYKHLLLLGKDNRLRHVDLGLVHSSAGASVTEVILNRLKQDGDVEEQISPNFLVRNWPPAFTAWPTKAARDAFFASAQFPRLLKPEALKESIARGVEGGILGYVGKAAGGGYQPFHFEQTLSAAEVELSDEMFIITAEEAQKHVEPPKLARLQVSPTEASLKPGMQQAFAAGGTDQYGGPCAPAAISWQATGGQIDREGVFTGGEDEGNFLVTAAADGFSATASVTVAREPVIVKPGPDPEPGKISWTGEVPPQKWMNLYMKVLTKFAGEKSMRLTVRLDVTPENGVSQQRIDEARVALRELGLSDDVEVTG